MSILSMNIGAMNSICIEIAPGSIMIHVNGVTMNTNSYE